jgi:hypothetical protein
VRELWLRVGRPLWVLFAFNGILFFVMTMGAMVRVLQQPSARLSEGLAAHGLSLEFYAGFFLITNTLFFLTFFIVALLIFLRRPTDGFALFVAIFLVNFGASSAYPSFTEFLQFYNYPPVWFAIPYLISTLFSWTFLVAFCVLYPDGHFVPRWAWIPAVMGFFVTAAWGLSPATFTDPTTPLGIFGGFAPVVLTMLVLYCQYWRYRHYASPVQRQQSKWFLFAVVIVLFTTAITLLPPVLFGVAQSPAETIRSDLAGGITGNFAFIVLPIAIGFAILRYRLWDIDLLIRKTLTYGLLTAFLVAIYFASVVILQRIFASLLGSERNEIVTVASTLAIAALFVPLRNRIQDWIDRRFYRRKYDTQLVMQSFGVSVRDETDLETLTARLMQVVTETMQPKSVSVWVRDESMSKRKT